MIYPQIVDPAHLLVDPGVSRISLHPVLVPSLGNPCPPSSQRLVPARMLPSVVPPQPRCRSLLQDQDGSPLHFCLSPLLISLSPVDLLFITTDGKAWDGRHGSFNNVHKHQKYKSCTTNLNHAYRNGHLSTHAPTSLKLWKLIHKLSYIQLKGNSVIYQKHWCCGGATKYHTTVPEEHLLKWSRVWLQKGQWGWSWIASVLNCTQSLTDNCMVSIYAHMNEMEWDPLLLSIRTSTQRFPCDVSHIGDNQSHKSILT